MLESGYSPTTTLIYRYVFGGAYRRHRLTFSLSLQLNPLKDALELIYCASGVTSTTTIFFVVGGNLADGLLERERGLQNQMNRLYRFDFQFSFSQVLVELTENFLNPKFGFAIESLKARHSLTTSQSLPSN